MSYQRKTLLNWTLTETNVQLFHVLTTFSQELLASAEALTVAGTWLSIFAKKYYSGKFSPTSSSTEATPNEKPSTSVASSTATRPTSYSKGKSNERKKIPRKS